MNEISVTELKSRLASGDQLMLVDVREPHEHDEYNLGGVNIPVTELPFRTDELKNDYRKKYWSCWRINHYHVAYRLSILRYNYQYTIFLP